MQPSSGILGILVAIVLSGGCSEPARTASRHHSTSETLDRPGSPPRDAYETFDVVWNTVDRQHFDPDHNGVDWDEVRTTYRPRIEDTRSQADVRALLSEMIGELDQSHFVIVAASGTSSPRGSEDVPSESDEEIDGDVSTDDASAIDEEDDDIVLSAEGYTGIRLDFEGDDIVVAHVERGSSAAEAGVRPGLQVVSIDGINPNSRFLSIRSAAEEDGSHMANYYLYAGMNAMASGRPGQRKTFEFLDEDGEAVDIEVEVESKTGDTTDFMQMGPMTTKFSSHVLTGDELRSLGLRIDGPDAPRILLITFDNWMFPIMGPLRATMDEHRDVDGVIIDLRGNPGGAGGLAMGVAGFFFDEPLSLGDMKMRESTMHFRVNPQKVTLDGRIVEPFAKPVAIVVDNGSASTSEIFAGGMQKLGRATVVGRRTAGAALPAHLMRLPNGDRFMYAVADFLDPDGNTIEGVGVTPDRDVRIDRQLLARRGDPDLAIAAEVILADTPN